MNYQVSNFEIRDWDRIIASLPHPQILQTWEWGIAKSQYGWKPEQLVWYENDRIIAAALTLKRSLKIPLFPRLINILYIPKGPLLDWSNHLLRQTILSDLYDYAKINKVLFVKIDPDVAIGKGLPARSEPPQSTDEALLSDLVQHGWRLSDEQVQFKNTVLIDLSPTEEELLAKMKQKTRYNIRLASRKGLTVRLGTLDDIGLLYQMYAETSIRDGFVIRSKDYYKYIWGSFIRNQHLDQGISFLDHDQPIAEPLIAEADGEPVAAVILFRFARKAWYMYGMSRKAHREKMPNHLLQWEAMRRAKAAGCHTYDLWGAPDSYNQNDPLWGVYQFKEGLGGSIIRYLGAWDLPIDLGYYKIYSSVLPRLLEMMRRIGRKSTRQSILK
jgi:lipid II:glycine glycyltransferase (peptidoglycan interpeptide bridge formation enzyme)